MKTVGFGFGIGINPLTGDFTVIPMTAKLDDNGEIKFFMDEKPKDSTEDVVKEAMEKSLACDLCGTNQINDLRKFYLRSGSNTWSEEAVNLCDECKLANRGMFKIA